MNQAADEVIDLYLAQSKNVSWGDFVDAVDLKVKATGDKSVLNQLYDEVIANIPNEFDVARTRLYKADAVFDALLAGFGKVETAAEKAEQIRLYDDVINHHQNSDNELVLTIPVVFAMERKARLLDEKKEKIALLKLIIQKFDKYDSGVAKSSVRDAKMELARLGAK